ncbi:MAG: type I-C CRISPR-associated protein Cas5c [Treponema sp.]|uniref:type I-C CRISPR-associated protein Cas5c n=1 Tax=Treponema sp. TaxID=166 RepID=UPI00298E1CAE|nr:type I-C CRISPR-associated protein Cas5c [Treponema sp.]MCQ2601726.1 type I-C CRISPR-associated protein Cas5c [Treponema sp.]
MKENSIEYRVWGSNALFTDPITKIGGEKSTYQIPTYEALKGITQSIYWKPTIVWVIDKVRIINKIRTESKNVKPICYSGGNDLSIYTYLRDVEYQVKAHFEWNMQRSDLEGDRNEDKHFDIAKRSLAKGGRRDIFLGARECYGYVEPCKFGEGESFYDNDGEFSFGMMFHGFDYPTENPTEKLTARFWNAKMNNGIMDFPRPETCTVKREIRNYSAKKPTVKNVESED